MTLPFEVKMRELMAQTVSVAEMMARSGVAFGTSGARGLVTAMTDLVCFTYTSAFLQHLESIGQFVSGKAVAIAGDLRPSTPRLMSACAAAIQHKGGEVIDCGMVPSPAVAAYGFARKIPSLMVTGSHIPDDRNGIKFNRIDGEILKRDELAMRAHDVVLPDLFDDEGMLRAKVDPRPIVDVERAYVARYVDFFGKDALGGLKLGIYEHSAVGRDLLAQIVEKLGGEVVRLGRSETFIPVDTEAVRREDQKLAFKWSKEFGLDAILSTDGDSDRPLLADETGAWMRGDVLGILCARALGITAVAAPVSCNTALELCGAFEEIRRTRIGSPFVIEAMNALIADGHETVCGYEANGGFLLGLPVESDGSVIAELPTRDAVLPMVAVLVEACKMGIGLTSMLDQFPLRYTFSDRLEDYPTSKSLTLISDLQKGEHEVVLDRLTSLFGDNTGKATLLDATDGLRVTFESGDIIHLRPSGNAPEFRCYTESETAKRAIYLNNHVLEKLLNWKPRRTV